jgi:GNAT superfamily N-acetyltransferase
MDVRIERVNELAAEELQPLVVASVAEGYDFIERLAREFAENKNRFDKPGEAFFLAYDGDKLVGTTGLNVDPFMGDPTLGRIRRVYLLPEYRGHGTGRRLLVTALEAARPVFRGLTLWTNNPVAANLYESVGFVLSEDYGDHTTHFLALK